MNLDDELANPRKIDLSRLNAAEQTALGLLAEGHTVKSIAEITGRTATAVNERLRQARRKAGVGSSRELARLLKAQKIRDREIDLSPPALSPEDAVRPASAHSPRVRKGQIAMTISLVSALTLATAVVTQVPNRSASDQATHVAPDAELYALLPTEPFDGAGLHQRLNAEPREAAWADRTEMALRTRYSAIAHVNDGGPLRVRCGSALCEVTNAMPPHGSLQEKDVQALYQALQSPRLAGDLTRVGLAAVGTLFTATKDPTPRGVFVSYWSRMTDAQPHSDPRLDAVLQPEEKGERRLYTQLREEVRDLPWADRTEASLREMLTRQIGPDNQIHAACSATLCEIALTMPLASTKAISDAFYDDLQSRSFQQGMAKLGLDPDRSFFRQLPSDPARTIFVGYFRRTKF